MEKKNLKIRSLLFNVWCMSAIGLSFTSCDKNNDPPPPSLIDTGSTVTLPQTRAFLLNRGIQGERASIAFYAPNKDRDFIENIYMEQNKKKLSYHGTDIIIYNNYMYVSVGDLDKSFEETAPGMLLKLNSAGVEVARLLFSKEDGDPFYLVAENGKIYVTLSGQKVARIDAETMKIEEYVPVQNPYGIAKDDNYFYVTSDYNYSYITSVSERNKKGLSTLTIIDKKTFKVAKTIVVDNGDGAGDGAEQILIAEGQSFVRNGNKGDNFAPSVHKVDVTKGTVTTIAKATRMCEYRGIIYMVYGEPYGRTRKTNTFSSYNVKTGMLNKTNFLIDMPKELAEAYIYMLEVNPNNGDIYIGTLEPEQSGDVYRFDRNGKFIDKFRSVGFGPRKIVFFN